MACHLFGTITWKRRQAVTWNICDLLSNGLPGTTSSEILKKNVIVFSHDCVNRYSYQYDKSALHTSLT